MANDNAFVLNQDPLDRFEPGRSAAALECRGCSAALRNFARNAEGGLSETQIDGAIVDLIEDRLAVPSPGRARVAAVPACVVATRRATEALPDRRSASGRCFVRVHAPPLGEGRFPAALLDRPFSAAASRRSELVLDQTGILQQSDDFSPHNPIEEILTDWPVIAYWSAKMPPGVRPPSIGNSGFYERSTWSMYATSRSRISGTIPAPGRCWVRSSDVAQTSCFVQASLGLA